MYTRQETSLLTKQFWTSLGLYLAPVLSAEGEKINWVNYKTGRKGIRFIMAADNKSAKISIRISHPDAALQQLYLAKFIQLKNILQPITKTEWQWPPLITGQPCYTASEIFTTLTNVNVFNKTDWPAIISFLKPRIIALDSFWCEYKYLFERSSL